ncbi:MAG: hypothetical protein MJY82_10705, partial [Fibrobacter sp.]|nr:hypothetical protein [Fibrobacter sp.]
KGKLNIKNSFSAGSVEGKYYVGGFVGSNRDGAELKIENSYSESSVNASNGIVGGLVGYNEVGTLNVLNCYNVGAVTASNGFVGGLVGYNEDGTLNVLNCYNVGAVGGKQYIGGLVGANVKTMSVSNSFFIGTDGDGDKLGGEAKTPNEFADGTVALLLHNWCEMDGGVCKADGLDGSVWGQNVGQASDNDATPTLSGMLKLGLLAIAKDAAGKETVAIDGNSALEVKIPADIHVDYVKFNRTFTQGIVATIVLPFDVPSSALPGNAEFGTLKSVGPNPENGGKWEAVFTTVTELEAHTPYLVRLTSGTSLDFKFGEAGVTIKATEEYDEVSGKMVTVPTSSTSTDEQWELVGTYSYKSWQDGDLGIGSTYGFAGSAEGEKVVAGQFVKVGAGAYINPMRVYLQKVTKVNPGRRALGNASVLASIPEELPESIDVVFVDSDDAADANEVAAGSDSAAEKTTYIGRINTRTGAIELKRTYDAKGRMLNSKPTAKGNYFNKKVIK